MERREVHDVPRLKAPPRPTRSPPPKHDYPLTPVDDPPEYTHVPVGEDIARSADASQDPALKVQDPSEVKGRWKHLFAFTRWSHAWPLAAAMVATVIAAGLKTA